MKKKPTNQDRGWKLDPKDPTQARFWNGVTWTQQLATITPEESALYAAAEEGETVGLPAPPTRQAVTATLGEPTDPSASTGYGLAILLPPVGLLFGLALLVRGVKQASSIVVTSIIAGGVWFILWDLISSGTM